MKILKDEEIAEKAIVCWEALEEHERRSFQLVAQAQLEDCERQMVGEIEEAKKQERERIMSLLDEMSDYGQLILPIGQIRQALNQLEGKT